MTLKLRASSLQHLSRTSISGFINASIFTNISFVNIQCTFRWNLWSFKKSEWNVLKGLLFLCWAYYIDKGSCSSRHKINGFMLGVVLVSGVLNRNFCVWICAPDSKTPVDYLTFIASWLTFCKQTTFWFLCVIELNFGLLKLQSES